MRRHLLALGALAILVGLAGCASVMGPTQQPAEELVGNATYDWDNDANATIHLNGSAFTGVYAVENRSTFEVFSRDGLGQERGFDLSSVRFRYPNGTELTVRNESLAVERGGGRTTITLPGNATGQLAFTAPRFGKSFGLPTFVEGSYDVTLPRGARVGIPLLGQVSPPGFTTTVEDGRMTLSWDDVDGRQFRIAWYLQRDVYIFGGIVLIGALLAIGGTLYYYRQIRQLEARRKEVGLDMEVDADDDPRDKGPPPGMR